MPSGTLGQNALVSQTNTIVYTVPSTKLAVINISICNTTTDNVTTRVAITSSGTPALAEYIEYDATVAGNGVLERTGVVVGENKNVIVFASASGIAVNVYGYEDVLT